MSTKGHGGSLVSPRGNFYWTDFRDQKGRRVRVTTGFRLDQRDEATMFAMRLKMGLPAESAGGVVIQPVGTVTVGEGFDRLYRERWAKQKTAGATRAIIAELKTAIGASLPLDQVDYEAVARVRAAFSKPKPASPGSKVMQTPGDATVQRKLAVLSTLLRHAARYWKVKTDINVVPAQKPSKVRMAYFDIADFAALARCEPDPLSRAMWVFLGEVGARYGEAVKLQWGDISWDERLVRFHDTKNGHDRRVPLTESAVDALLSCKEQGVVLPFGWLKYTGWLKRFHAAVQRAGLKLPKGTALHSLRHTCATLLIYQGADLREAKEWLGHSDIATTAKYAKVMPQQLRNLADRIGSVTKERDQTGK